MDSAFKNQILAKLGNTVGDNIEPAPTHPERDTIFLLTQYIADTMESLKKSVDNLTNAVNTLNNTVTEINNKLDTVNSSIGNVNTSIGNLNNTINSVITSFNGTQNLIRVAEPIQNGGVQYWVVD